MTTKLVLTDAFQVVSDGSKVVLAVPERLSVLDHFRYAIADAAPAANDETFEYPLAINFPKGAKVWVQGNGTLKLSSYDPA